MARAPDLRFRVIVDALDGGLPPIYCTGGCDACRDYARELGVALVIPPPPVLREALGHLNKVRPSGIHVERAAAVLEAALAASAPDEDAP